MLFPQVQQRRHENASGRRGEGRHANVPHHSARSGGEFRLRVLQSGEHALGVVYEPAARLGEAYASPGSLEKRDSGLTFEHRHLLGHRRGRHEERFGGGGDGPAAGDLSEHLESGHVQHVVHLTLCIRKRHCIFRFNGTMIALEQGDTVFDAADGAPVSEGGNAMYDSFSEGGVFYGRTMLVVAAAIAVAALFQLI